MWKIVIDHSVIIHNELALRLDDVHLSCELDERKSFICADCPTPQQLIIIHAIIRVEILPN